MKSTSSRGGKKYFITFFDDNTSFCYLYLLNCNDDTIDAFKHCKNEAGNQLNVKIKTIWCDKGGEYKSSFAEICLKYVIKLLHLYTTVKWFGGTEE